MAQKIVIVPEVGEVILAKRRGSRNIRLSIRPDGKVRVGLPIWASYSVAIDFVSTRANWINHVRQTHSPVSLMSGHSIGKSYRLKIDQDINAGRTYSRLGINSITVVSPLDVTHPKVQAIAVKASERALKKEAEKLLKIRLDEMANQYHLPYKKLRITRFTSRWGSCSSDKVITLNYFLMQLPWPLIDYVIAHELAHIKHLNHSQEFWAEVERMVPGAKEMRKEIKKYRPVIMPK